MIPPDQPEDSASERGRRFWSRISGFQVRDAWWAFLDMLEGSRALRVALYTTVAVVLLGGATVLWGYPWWRQRTVVSMARQWLEAGRLDHASESIQEALKVAPERPESWKLAADLARRLGNQTSALAYSQKAAELAPDNVDLILAWAADALLANRPEETDRALAALPPGALAHSSHGNRIAGELARRRLQLTDARIHFETALRIDGPGSAINEVPLGIILLNARDPAERQRGLDLLAKWTTSVEWGANALRSLLNDAIVRDDRTAMLRWADALRAHPRCTLGDIPQCLLALSKSDETRFKDVLAVMEKNHAVDSANVAMLAGWLNQIGRSREALAWTRSLPETLTHRPPAAIAVAEALRATSAWPELDQWMKGAPWESSLEFIHLIYRLEAALQLEHLTEARELMHTLEAKAPGNGGQTLFVASTLYAWGRREEALPLLWIAADQPGSAVEALGTLVRHFQEKRDAAGQLTVFKRLRGLRADDAAVGNNFAFFAALTGQDMIAAGEVAARNFKQDPANRIWRSTHAFVLLKRNRPQDALAVIEPVAADWKESPPVAFAYGLTLAATGQKPRAREILATLPPETMTREEAALIKAATR